MGYGYAETFLIVFLTSPGVIIPTTGSAAAKLTSFLPGEVADLVPSGGLFPPPMSALWQVLWVWILSLPGEQGPAFGWTMYALYIVFLLAYMYTIGRMRIAWGV
jgi:hypothetical protein